MNIQIEIEKAMKILNISRMPTVKELRNIKFNKLEREISNTGGFVYWANKLDLSVKASKTILTEKEIIESIYEVMNKLDIDRMPSCSEIKEYYGNEILTNKIKRTKGSFGWANYLKLNTKESETKLAIKYQDICYDFLTNKGYHVEKMPQNYTYDLLINNNIKIDVKSASAYFLGSSRCHSFGINKKNPTCDLYILYALSEDSDIIERIFIIPSKYLHVVTMSIGSTSFKYDKFLNNWEAIAAYDNFYNNMI